MTRVICKPPWLKVWSGITGIALSIALILTFLPVQVSINTNGILSIDLSQAQANPDGWLTDWPYRIAHNFTGATGAGTNYQMKVIVHSGNGTNSGEDVYLGERCTDFPNDIRFTDDDAITELDHWCEDLTADPATFWVEVADSLESGTVPIYIYCGSSETEWIEYKGNPILQGTGTLGNFDRTDVADPIVLKEGSTYRMWYNGASPTNDPWITQEGYAYSSDGVSWTRGTHNPVLSVGGAGSWDEIEASKLSVVHKDGYYCGVYSGWAANGTRALGWANKTDTDPSGTFTKGANNPILQATEEWEDDYLDGPTLRYCDTHSRWELWYSSGKTPGLTEPENQCFAYCSGDPSDPDDWVKYAGNPIASALGNDDWNGQGLGSLRIFDDNGTLYGMYGGFSNETPKHCRIGLVTLIDETTWNITPEDLIIDLGEAGTWNDYMVYSGTLMKDGDIWKIWANAADGSRERIGLWTLTASESNGNDTFIFFDDFVDIWPDGQWTGDTAYGSVASGILTMGSADSVWKWLKSNTAQGSATGAMRALVSQSSAKYSSIGFDDGTYAHRAYRYMEPTPNQYILSKDGSTQTVSASSWTYNTYKIIDIIVRGGNNTRGFENDVEVTGSPKTTNPPNSASIKAIIGAFHTTACILVDWVLQRKYVYPEPAHGTWGEWEEEEVPTPEITNTPDSNDFGILAVNSTSNTGIDYFTITNTGNCAVDVVIYGTDATGGDDTWDLDDTGTPGENIYGLYAGLDDADDLFDVIVRETETYNTLVSGLAEDATQDWGLKIYMPTSLSEYDCNQMSANITLVVSAS